jgi:hypothetical protein
MRSTGIAIGLVVLLSGAAIQAQEDAGVGDAEGEIADASDAGVAAVEAKPAEPEAVSQEQVLTPAEILALDPSLYSGQERRLIVSKQRKIRMLERIMQREGPEYDAAKDELYRNRFAGGVLLDVAAAGAFVAGLALLLHTLSDDSGFESCEGTAGEADCEARARDDQDGQGAVVAVVLSVGAVLAAVGIPLTITASRGRKRQQVLRRKDEILEECRMLRLDFTASSGSGGPGGGLMLSGSF